MDVFTGAVVARYASMLAARISPSCDRLLEKLSGRQAGIRSKTRVMIGGADYPAIRRGDRRRRLHRQCRRGRGPGEEVVEQLRLFRLQGGL